MTASQGPVFIVGAPRSGTTLLRNTLNRHPALAICRETQFFHYVYRRRKAFGSLAVEENRRRLLQQYLSLDRLRRTRLDLAALERCLLEEGTSYPDLFASLLRFYMRVHGKQRWGEKTPGHARFTETLFEWYPDATVIHIVRDPRDVVASLMDMPFFPNNIVGNANLWLTHNRSARRSQHRSGYLLVRYEKLVTDSEGELRRICDALGEPYSPVMLLPKPDPTADRPWFERAEQPVTETRIGIWRQRLTATDAALVEWWIGPELQIFGYEPEARPPSLLDLGRAFAFGVKDAISRRVGEFPGVWYARAGSTEIVKEETAKAHFHHRNLTPANGS